MIILLAGLIRRGVREKTVDRAKEGDQDGLCLQESRDATDPAGGRVHRAPGGAARPMEGRQGQASHGRSHDRPRRDRAQFRDESNTLLAAATATAWSLRSRPGATTRPRLRTCSPTWSERRAGARRAHHPRRSPHGRAPDDADRLGMSPPSPPVSKPAARRRCTFGNWPGMLKRLLDGCEFLTLADLERSAVEQWLNRRPEAMASAQPQRRPRLRAHGLRLEMSA